MSCDLSHDQERLVTGNVDGVVTVSLGRRERREGGGRGGVRGEGRGGGRGGGRG